MKLQIPSALSTAPSFFILAFMASLGPFGDTEYTPSLPSIARAMGVAYGQAQLTMTVYLFGFAIGQMLYGPVSDSFGRRPTILFAITTFLLGSLICAVSVDLDMMLFGRFVQSAGACAGGILSNAAVRDAFPPEEQTRVFLEVNTVFALAPGAGPIAGSLIEHYLGWEANFYLLAILACLLLISLLLFFPETNRHRNPNAIRPVWLLKNYLSLFRHWDYVCYVLVVGIGESVVYCSLVAAPALVMIEIGLPSKTFIIVTTCVSGAFLLGAAACGLSSKFVSDAKLIVIGWLIILAGALAIGYFNTEHRVTLPTMLGPISFIFGGVAFVIPVSTSIALAPFEKITGSASALLGGLSMGMASSSTYLMSILAGSPSFVVFFAFTSLAVIGLALAVLGQVFFDKAASAG
jgi:DHA1 family bicyclomycin/chloramphenicol resistance-like MFS transporter